MTTPLLAIMLLFTGTVLGADAFYWENTGFNKLISGGRVVIESNVGIGALCTMRIEGITGDTSWRRN